VEHAATLVPIGLIAFVLRREETLVWNADGASDEDGAEHVADDAYLRAEGPKSVLCAPMRRRRQGVHGVVYLENRDVAGVFTPDLVTLGGMVATFFSLALDNAASEAAIEARLVAANAELEGRKQAQLVVERNAMERDMAGGFAHELRNALSGPGLALGSILMGDATGTSIVAQQQSSLEGLAQRVRQGIDLAELEEALQTAAADAAEMSEVIRAVDRGIKRALSVTQQALTYAQSGAIQVGGARIDLSKVVDAVLRDQASSLSGQDILVNLSLEAGAEASMKEEHAYAILNNFVANARDAMKERQGPGRAELQIASQVQGDMLHVRVTDNGVGIAPENRAKIFRPFFTTKGVNGVGLGLGMAKRLAELYGGRVHFESERDRGTTFSLLVPLARKGS
jgi:signal transduction histidine kinase